MTVTHGRYGVGGTRNAATVARDRYGSDEPGVSRAETQSTGKEKILPLQASVDGFLRFNCTSPEQECILLQPDVEVDDEKD